MSELTHLDAQGHARMVDIGAKVPTERKAIASGRIRMAASALTAIRDGEVPKGDVLPPHGFQALWPPRKPAN